MTTYSLMDELLASPATPMPPSMRRHQLTRMWQGLASIERAAKPTQEDWRVCSDAVNLMETLVRMNIAEDLSGLLPNAVEALAQAALRCHTTGILRLDGNGITATRTVLEDYAQVLVAVSHRTMVRCHRQTESRNREILSGRNRPHDVQVIAF